MVKLKDLLKEEKITEGKVDRVFTKIIGLLRKESRKLNDVDMIADNNSSLNIFIS